MSRVDVLRRTSLFFDLADSALGALDGSLVRQTYARGMILFHKGSHGQRLYIVESGKVREYALSETGQEITLGIRGPGHFVGELGFLDDAPRSTGAVTMEQTVTLTLEREDFLYFMKTEPRLAQHCVDLLCERLRRLTAYVESLAFLDIQSRVAYFLLELAQHYGERNQYGIALQVHMTQGEMASCVATSRETVNRVISVYRDLGLISLDGNTIIILDMAGLRRHITY